jgi:hypothetical protein
MAGSWTIRQSPSEFSRVSTNVMIVMANLCGRKAPYILSPAGEEVQGKLWEETIAEMSKLTTLPALFT